VAGIGEVVARSVYDFFQEPRNRTILEKLRAAGVRFEDGGEKPKAGSQLSGLTFVLTGRLEKLTRPQAEEFLRRAGANVAGSVSKKTSYVVAGEDAGSKADRAKELGVQIIDEQRMLSMLDGSDAELNAVKDGKNAKKSKK
jgi:DNA ligase (NAD+)